MLRRSDVIVPEILTEAIQGYYAGVNLLWGTEAAVISPTMPTYAPTGGKIRGGDTVRIPYFGTIGELDDVPEGDALTPVGLDMSSETATVVHSGKAIEITEWAKLATAFSDPYAEMARQLMVATGRRGDKALMDAALAGLGSDQILDVSGADTKLTLDTLIDARMIWEEEQEDIAFLAVHPKVFGNLWKLKDTTGRPLYIVPADAPEKLATLFGVPIKPSIKVKVDKTDPAHPKYHNLLIKKRSLAFWFSKEPTVATDDDILADTHLAAVHMYWAAHRYKRMPTTGKPGVVDIVTTG